MKKFRLLPLLSLTFLFSCAGDDQQKTSGDSTADSLPKKQEVHIPKLDSAGLKISDCSFHCTRSKTVKDVDKVVHIFGGTMNMKLDNASFSAETDIKVKSGYWYTIDGKMKNGLLVLDMASVEAVKVGADQQLEMGNPDYLETKTYPYAYLKIDSVGITTDSIGKTSYSIPARLQLKNKEEPVELKNIKYANADAVSGIPEQLSFDFTINGIEWGLNKKDAKVTKDQLKFHVIMKRG
ncbi:MAG TPA: YceI family protein [Bacteroidia bacterium]|jgi:hypothetical protein|nr:YceI family protein [Bacteroidia bacterium]